VWTIPELALDFGGDTVREILPNSTASPTYHSPAHSSKGSRKRRGNSYKAVCDSLPPSILKLTPEVRNLVEDFLSTCNPEIEELTSSDPNELRFNRAEETDFVPITEPDRAKCLVYINSNGWQIVVELADIRPE